jgi:hypothetical protein
MDDALDETLTAKENAFRRALWTREEVLGLLLLQRRDDAAAIRAHVVTPGHCAGCDMANVIADEIDPTTGGGTGA